jgi:uncharacterized membrane protein
MNAYVPPPPSRPLGVAVLSVLIGVLGGLFLVAGILLFVGIAALSGFSIYGVGLVGAAILLIVGVVLLVVARGLWDLELWALALALLVLVLYLGVNLYDLATGRGASAISIAVELILVTYLIAVSRYFR